MQLDSALVVCCLEAPHSIIRLSRSARPIVVPGCLVVWRLRVDLKVRIMMKLFVDTIHESDWARARWLDIAENWRRAGQFQLVGGAREADAVLITLADCRSSYP